MKLFNIFCTICLCSFAFSSCEQLEVIEPETDVQTQDLNNLRTSSNDIFIISEVSKKSEGTEPNNGGNDNTAEICLVDFSSAEPVVNDNNWKNSEETQTRGSLKGSL